MNRWTRGHLAVDACLSLRGFVHHVSDNCSPPKHPEHSHTVALRLRALFGSPVALFFGFSLRCYFRASEPGEAVSLLASCCCILIGCLLHQKYTALHLTFGQEQTFSLLLSLTPFVPTMNLKIRSRCKHLLLLFLTV